MAAIEDFLTRDDEQAVVEAIRLAEKETSGEIRVHIEMTTELGAYDRALEVFHQLEMHKTAHKNGVLIYVAIADKAFAICGDKGIDDVVADHFWDSTKELIAAQFKIGDFKQGLIDGIRKTGSELQRYFPCDDDDTDELSNEISKG